MTIVVTYSNKSLEACTLTSSCLFLYWHNLHNFINHFLFHEVINDLEFFDWDTEKVNFFKRFDFSSFD